MKLASKKVVPINCLEAEEKAKIIEDLATCLEGDRITGVGFFVVEDGDCLTRFWWSKSALSALGAAERLKDRVLNCFMGRED